MRFNFVIRERLQKKKKQKQLIKPHGLYAILFALAWEPKTPNTKTEND